MLIGGVCIYFFLANGRESDGSKYERREAESEVGFEGLLAVGSSDALINYTLETKKDIEGTVMPDQIRAINEHLAICDRLEQIEDEQNIDLNGQPLIIRMEALAALDRINRANNLVPTDKKKDVRAYAISQINNERPHVAHLARLMLIESFADEFKKDASSNALREFNSHARKGIRSFHDDTEKMLRLFSAIKSFAIDGAEELVNLQDLLHDYGDQFCESKIEKIADVGVRLHDLAILGDLNTEDLMAKISFGDKRAIQEAKDFAASAKSSSKFSEVVFVIGVQLAEAVERNGNQEIANEMVRDLVEAAKLQSNDVQASVDKVLANARIRHQIIGKKIELSGKDLNETPIDFSDFEGKPVVLVYFELNRTSLDAMHGVLEAKNYFVDGMRFVAVAIADVPANRYVESSDTISTDQKALLYQSFVERFDHVQFIPEPGAGELQKQCPILSAPYALLLNPDHEVVVKNLEVHELRRVLESMDWWF